MKFKLNINGVTKIKADDLGMLTLLSFRRLNMKSARIGKQTYCTRNEKSGCEK